MSNISIYLNQSLQSKLDVLIAKGMAQDLESQVEQIPTERSRSALIARMIELEYDKLIEVEMIADAIVIDNENLGWDSQEEECQITDMEVSG